MKIPIITNSRHVYEKLPIIKFEVLDASTLATQRVYSIDKSVEFLFINESTGELWLKEETLNLKDEMSIKEITIISRHFNTGNIDDGDDDESEAKATANIIFVAYSNVRDFCEKSMCFYDAVELQALEDFNGNFKIRDVGEIAPRFYRKICRKYHIEYKLLNGKLKRLIFADKIIYFILKLSIFVNHSYRLF